MTSPTQIDVAQRRSTLAALLTDALENSSSVARVMGYSYLKLSSSNHFLQNMDDYEVNSLTSLTIPLAITVGCSYNWLIMQVNNKLSESNDPPEPRYLHCPTTTTSTRPPDNEEPMPPSEYYQCVQSQIDLIKLLDIYPVQDPAAFQEHNLYFHRLKAFFPITDADRELSEQCNETQSIQVWNLYKVSTSCFIDLCTVLPLINQPRDLTLPLPLDRTSSTWLIITTPPPGDDPKSTTQHFHINLL
ncbi:uncharacterized protein MELLADRAFT_106091 [Melampsora larici-populina 98AG31]|uniref:Uncharacterized protein n=1 Tax=Melampsora larici-populina (strain 98AG31 / pathotype 3-4-7) TaxID=747676 RepID=F4RKC9_MELLP|nr:uncharacterized protein MELLADRAFT_106091 [Melampsora larici-populina 98AG31]EGG07074.1 hypothetical protein MELLADRAFT_106091 [Melampsora larici-populina 98AG31]